MRRRFEGKTVIVTGATGGIGRAITASLAQEGANLVLAGTRADFPDRPTGSSYLPGDITDEGYAHALAAEAITKFGGLNALVNAHGVDYHSDLAVTPLADAEDVLRVNVLGVLLTTKHAAPAMVQTGGGVIVNLASRLGMVAIPGQAVYSASKGAVIMLTRGAAIDLAPRGIRVNAVAPGMTATTMIADWVERQSDPSAFAANLVRTIPLGRLAQPEEIAAAVLFLASDESSYITGAVLPVDGGYTAT